MVREHLYLSLEYSDAQMSEESRRRKIAERMFSDWAASMKYLLREHRVR